MNLKKNIKKVSLVLSISAIPVATLTSCSGTKDTNYITSAFYNSYDMLTALGIAPKTQAYANQGLNKKYWDYMEPYINESATKFAVFGQGSSTPNLAQLKSFQTYTLVLNEWARVDENKYIGSNNSGAKHVAYTSMGDSKNSKYFDETSKGKDPNIDWHDYKEGFFSYRAATKMLAEDLDKYFYPNSSLVNGQKFNSYIERAEFIFRKDIERINNIRTQIQKTSLNGKTIGIFSGQDGGGGYVKTDKLQAIYEPFLYPQLYGPENIGFGLKFPKPETKFSETLKWADPGNLASVKVIGQETLKEVFQNKFDYIIYVNSPGEDENSIKQQYTSFDIKSFFKQSNSLNSKSNTYDYDEVNNKKFVSVNYEDWYPTAWGPIGVQKLVSEMVKVLNIFLKNDLNNSKEITDNVGNWDFYEKNSLINPNKKEPIESIDEKKAYKYS